MIPIDSISRCAAGVALVLAVSACGGSEAATTTPPRAATPTPGAQPPAARRARVEMRAALVGNVDIVGAIHVDSVNAAFAQVAPAIGRCASDATERGLAVQTVATRVQIEHDGSLSAASAEVTPAADAAFVACTEAALRAQGFPSPLGPPMPGFEIPAGHDASEFMVANARATFALTRP